MAYTITWAHLCVGQGLSVLLNAVYDKSDKTQGRFVGLFDLGSSSGGEKFYKSSLQEIAAAVHQNNGVLDYVHISHFDYDHYNLFNPLALIYAAYYGKAKIKIDRLIIGSGGKLSIAELEERAECFAAYQVAGPIQYFISTSGYHTGSPYVFSHALAAAQDIHLPISGDYFLQINTLCYHAHLYPGLPFMNDGVSINTGSSIVLIAIVDRHNVPRVSALFTGDATLHTFRAFNSRADFTFSSEPKTLTISHHGAKTNIADNNTTDFTTLSTFLTRYTPTLAYVSAKCRNSQGWTHPDINTMKIYDKYVTGAAPKMHRVTTFTFTDRMIVKQMLTGRQIWSTFDLEGIKDGLDYKTAKSISRYYVIRSPEVTWKSI